MSGEGIMARIAIGRCKSGDVAYIYDIGKLASLNIPEDSETAGTTFLIEGTAFELEDKKYKILAVRTNFLNQILQAKDENGHDFDYNFEITYFVEEA